MADWLALASSDSALWERLKQVSEPTEVELGRSQDGQKRCYDSKVNPLASVPGQKVLFLLPSSDNKLLVKWQELYEIVNCKGVVEYERGYLTKVLICSM